MDDVKVCFWNVHGLTQNANLYDKFVYISRFDIFALAETWLSSEEELPYYFRENYTCIFAPATPSDAQRNLGGMCLGIRKSEHVSVLRTEVISNELIYIKIVIGSHVWNLIALHNRTENFQYNLIQVQKILNCMHEDEDLLLMGDFNVRIGTRHGRASQDTEVQGPCAQFLGFKNENCLSILNGTLDDYGGKFTYVSPMSSKSNAVIDYVLVKDSCPHVNNFEVNSRMDVLSDHRPLETTIYSEL